MYKNGRTPTIEVLKFSPPHLEITGAFADTPLEKSDQILLKLPKMDKVNGRTPPRLTVTMNIVDEQTTVGNVINYIVLPSLAELEIHWSKRKQELSAGIYLS
jgi:hypothetical protein